MRIYFGYLGSLGGLTLALAGCSASNGGDSHISGAAAGSSALGLGGTSSGPATGHPGAGGPVLGDQQMSMPDGGSGGKPADQVITMLPADFHATDIGGYKLGAPLTPGSS